VRGFVRTVAADGRSAQPQLAKQLVQHHAGAGAARTIDEAHAGPCEVEQAAQAERVAARNDQALAAAGEADQLVQAGRSSGL
jgi:hypothetical protein